MKSGPDGEGAARAHRRRHDGLQGRPRRDRRRHGEGGRRPAQEGPRLGRQEGRADRRRGRRRILHPRRRQARRAGRDQLRDRLRGPHRRASRSWCRTSPCTSRPPTPASRRREEVTADVLEREKRDLPGAGARLRQAARGGREDRSRASSRSSTPRPVLLEQPFVKNPDQITVGRMVDRDGRQDRREHQDPPLRPLQARRGLERVHGPGPGSRAGRRRPEDSPRPVKGSTRRARE